MKQHVKTVVYQLVTYALLIWAALRCAALGSGDALIAQGGLRAAEMTLLLLACVLIGGSVYLWRAVARRNAALRPDVWFGLGVGLVLLVLWFVSFWVYGGVSDVTAAAGIRARNFSIVCMSALPVAFLLRFATLAFFSKDENRKRRITLCVIAGATLLGYAAFIAGGVLMNTLPAPATLP